MGWDFSLILPSLCQTFGVLSLGNYFVSPISSHICCSATVDSLQDCLLLQTKDSRKQREMGTVKQPKKDYSIEWWGSLADKEKLKHREVGRWDGQRVNKNKIEWRISQRL
jgi:hypothetical protein